jgi:putative methyltransferase (TIGR04325 family)
VRFIKNFCPPIFISLYRRFAKKSNCFSGVFNSVDMIDDENPWESKEWLDLSRQKVVRRVQEQKQANNFISGSDLSAHAAITCLMLNFLSCNNQCTVFDFGGGTGYMYYRIFPYVMFPEKIEWNVVDSNDELFAIGEQHSNIAQMNINFFKQMPQSGEAKIDLLFINTSLQYIYDYKSVLNMLLKYKPKYVILTRLLAGDIETYITRQTVEGRTTPCMFINIQEILQVFSEHNYSVIFKSPCSEESLTAYYDSNIPARLRIPCSVNLMFKRNVVN